MNGSVQLDTNIVIALFAGEPAVLERLAAAPEVFVPAVVIGELYYGAMRSGRAEANIARIDAFAASAAVIACNTETARHYGTIKNELRAKGRPIPENDIWVAAGARQHSLAVVSRDPHFVEIPNLTVETW